MNETKGSLPQSVWRVVLARGLVAFAGLNLLVALPMAALCFFCAPQGLELDAVGDGACSIAISYGKYADGSVDYCSSADLYDLGAVGKGAHLYRGRFPRTVNLDAPAFFIRSKGITRLTISNVRKKVGPFYKTLPPNAVVAAYRIDADNSLQLASNGTLELEFKDRGCRLSPTRNPVWSGWGISESDLDGWLWIIATVELLTLVLCLVIAIVRRRVLAGVRHVWQSVALSLITTFFFCYVVPFQSYCANSVVFPFGVSDLLVDIAPCSFFVLLTVFCGLMLVECVFGRIIHFILFACLIYEYLEVGVLLREAPSFTGDLSYYDNLDLIAIDCLVLSYAFIFVVIPYSKLKRFFAWMLAAMSMVFIAALLDSLSNGFKTMRGADCSKWSCNRQEVPPKVCYSSKRNVFVFVLDSVTSEVAKDAVLESHDLVEAFDGFIAFDLNLGAQFRSELATVNMFTGKYYRDNYYNKEHASEFARYITSDESALHEYLESAFQVYCMLPPPEFNCSYISMSNEDERHVNRWANSTPTSPLLWCPNGSPMASISVMMLSVFRAMPFCIKPIVFNWLSPIAGYADEEYLYPIFREAPVNDADGTFLYCHTHGVHVPHDVSPDGIRRGVVPPSYCANLCHAKSVFAELSKTLKAFKDKGVYDCSSILVIADHGAHVPQDAKRSSLRLEALPPVAFPMLWIKPAYSHGSITFDGKTPTTHGNLHILLRALKERDLTIDEITAMLRSEKRLFIRNTRDGYDQWDVGPDGAVQSFKHVVVP